MSLKQLLSDRRDEILTTFVRDVATKGLSPAGDPPSVLLDHIPLFLDELSAELGRGAAQGARVSEAAREHGEARWSNGYDLQAVIREYGVLRQVIVSTAKAANVPLAVEEYDVLANYLDIGIAAATAQYVRSRESELTAHQADLQFLTEAGELLGSSLDYHSTLTRLTRLVVPRMAEFCVVRLNGCSLAETPIAHADPEKVELVREILGRFQQAQIATAHESVMRTAQPVLMEAPPEGHWASLANTPEMLESLRALRVSSWIVVPLQIQANVIGTLTLARSGSGRPYAPSDLLLAGELARRAASAIDNAQLYELARSERARAEAATRSKDEFVAVVSHELRTPLNVIIGWVRLLRNGALLDDTRAHALEVVERNADAQSRLVADLLDISRVLTGKIRLDPAQVDLSTLVTLVLEDARHTLESKRIHLHRMITSEDAVMRGDGDRLKQILWNLLLNAIKFTPKGGQIWVSLQRVNSDLELEVTDAGVGITPEFLPHVFDSFRQFDSKITRPHSGLGVGLSITKHLVELHGGSIEVRSEGAGKGAAFLVRLPVSPIISTTVGVTKVSATTSARRQELTRHKVLAGVRVLVVDDEGDARELLRIILESCGMEVHDAESVQDALELIERTPLDVIISDIGMPDQDGYSLIRRVRASAQTEKAGIPAIALTAFARNEDRARALLEGFNVHMAKPVEPSELLIALSDVLGHSRKSES
jgi:signal transduction histidine kinase/ActR/RegA family two-component response regulator